MEKDPYQAPSSDVNLIVNPMIYDENQSAILAMGQKLVIYACMIYFTLSTVSAFLPTVFPFLLLMSLGLYLVGFFKILKTLKMHIIFKILFSMILIIPLINIIALFLLNSKVTKILKNNGYEVKFLGAKKINT